VKTLKCLKIAIKLGTNFTIVDSKWCFKRKTITTACL